MSKKKAEREVSAGGIVFRRDADGTARFLLIRDSYRHWGFPKGHLEDEETPAVAAERGRVVDILANADTLFARLSQGEGTLGLLSRDSTLYREATLTVVQLRTLLADIQANPRRYFRFSVF
jgi:8-oxo-dGTP pyrophosphatase MutT (NUDIX family)